VKDLASELLVLRDQHLPRGQAGTDPLVSRRGSRRVSCYRSPTASHWLRAKRARPTRLFATIRYGTDCRRGSPPG
jgi:hypothetical protein